MWRFKEQDPFRKLLWEMKRALCRADMLKAGQRCSWIRQRGPCQPHISFVFSDRAGTSRKNPKEVV